jgi:hypothetical protein
MDLNFLDKLDIAITVCDEQGIITYMNDKSALTFQNDGGKDLLNTDLHRCHPDDANLQINNMIENGTPNIYTIEKKGVKKLICQCPYPNGDKFGLIELSIELPPDMKHFIRG